MCFLTPTFLTLLGLQSRFGDNWGQTAWNLTGLSPKRGWSSKRVNVHADLSLFFSTSRFLTAGTHHRSSINPFRTAVPFWGQSIQISSSFVPKRDCGSKGVSCNNPNRQQSCPTDSSPACSSRSYDTAVRTSTISSASRSCTLPITGQSAVDWR